MNAPCKIKPVRTTCPYCGVGCGVVAKPDGEELLLPAIADVVREIDIAGGRIVVQPFESGDGESVDEST